MWIIKSTIPFLGPASCEAKTVLDHKTTSAPRRAKPRLSHEAKAKALFANSEATTASLPSSALLGSVRTSACGCTKALSAQIASLCEANSTLYRVQPRLSPEAKAKAFCANSEATTTPLASTAVLGSAKPAVCEAKTVRVGKLKILQSFLESMKDYNNSKFSYKREEMFKLKSPFCLMLGSLRSGGK